MDIVKNDAWADAVSRRWNGTAWVIASSRHASDTFCKRMISGIGAPNGTAAHTIGGPSPSAGCALNFTPAAGKLLVAVVAGAVTHTSTGTGAGSGWTERQSPVASSELSLFTKTAAGNDFLTLTHNGGNYPIAWAVYEFPTGSTYTNSSGGSAADNIFPALGSLPGTPQFVIAAYTRAQSGPTGTAANSTVPSPWIEDADLFSPNNNPGIDGVYFYLFHQEGFTGTSITPAFSPVFTGAGFTPDRQKVVAAFTLA